MKPTLWQELSVWEQTPAPAAPSQRQLFQNFTPIVRGWNNTRLYWRRHQLLHDMSPIFPRELASQLNAIDNEIARRKRAGTLKTRSET